MIQLQHLEGFYRVAKAGGYARAARDFPYPITAAGVHAQVRKLEQGLGKQLFVQVAKDRMTPTRAGQQLLEFCTPFFERLPGLTAALALGQHRGRVRIEAGALEVQTVLPSWLRRVRARHPEIEIDLREIDTPDYARLLRGDVDLIVDYQPHVPADIATRTVATHRAFLVYPADHPRARSGPDVKAFRFESFVALHPGQPHHAQQFAALRALDAHPPRVSYVPSVTSILALVGAGLGYSLIPWPDARGPRLRGLAARPLRGKGTRFPVTASWLAREEPDTLIEQVLRAVP
jgi:DNA-binding transcriptional LysR family regulator